MSKKHLSLILRIAGGVLLLALLIHWIGWTELTETVRDFHPFWYLIALGLLFLHYLLQSVVLRILLLSKGTVVRVAGIFRLVIISNFFGVFLPGAIGPDMVLCYNMVRSTEKKETALSAIIFIRIAVLFIMALIAFAFSFHSLSPGREVQALTGAVLLAFLGYYFVMASENSIALAHRLLAFLNRHRFTAVLYKTYFALSDYGRDRRVVLRCTPLLCTSAVIKIVVDYFIAQSLGFDIPLLYFFVFIPMITIISALPLTFAGLGVREGSFVGLFALAGIPAEQSMAVSLVSFSLVVVTAIIGAILYMFHGASLVTSTRPNDS